MLLGIAAVVVRARRAGPELRSRLLLSLAGVAFLVLVLLIGAALPETAVTKALWVSAPIPMFLTILVTMRGMYGIDRIVRPAIAYAVSLTLMLLTYAVVAVTVGSALGSRGSSSPLAVAAATLVAAAAGRPAVRALRALLDRHIDRRAWRAVREVQSYAVALSGGAHQPGGIAEAMTAALGDPDLKLGFQSSVGLIDANGARIDFGPPAPGRVRREVVVNGTLVAVIDLDGTLERDPGLIDSVLDAASLTIENASLHANASVHVAELRAASERIVKAGDDQRRRIERDLHDGAQQRIVALTMRLRLAEKRLADESGDAAAVLSDTVDELREALTELRGITQGLLPAVLVDEGLAVAIRALVLRAPLQVSLDVDEVRLPRTVEATAWFFVSEAVANAIKHADARSIRVTGHCTHDEFTVTVTDDGRGGAEVEVGTGMQGLADRLAAVGGRFEVHSPAGSGTTLEATIPCGS
jgi:signal transduction histidine kinase